MPGTTTRGDLQKPTTAEAADIAVINANMDRLSDYAVGDFLCTSTTHPATPWTGTRVFETDTGATLIWNGTAWIPDGVIRCTSTTRPTTVTDGQLLYETDTKFTYQRNGSAWKYRYGSPTYTLASSNYSSAVVTKTLFTCPSGTTFTKQCTDMVIGATYWVSLNTELLSNVVGDFCIAYVHMGTTAVTTTDPEILMLQGSFAVAASGYSYYGKRPFVATATTHTFGISGLRYGGTGQFQLLHPSLTISRESE